MVTGALLPDGENTSTVVVDGAASSIIMTACLRFAPADKSASGSVVIGVTAGTRKRFSEGERGNGADDANGVDAVSDISLRGMDGRALVMRELLFAMAGLVWVIVGDGDGG